MNRVASWLFAILILFPAAAAASTDEHFASPAQGVFSLLSPDFDGDHKPDVVTGSPRGLGYTLEIHFSSRIPSAQFNVPGVSLGFSIIVCDVNRDALPDLVVQASGSRFPAAVWLGDGRGHFVEGRPWDYMPVGLSGPQSVCPFAESGQPAIGVRDQRLSPEASAPSRFNAGLAEGRSITADAEQLLPAWRYFGAEPARSPPARD